MGAVDGPRCPFRNFGAGWSSPVARQAHNLKVVGSNPTPATKHPEKSTTNHRRRFVGRCRLVVNSASLLPGCRHVGHAVNLDEALLADPLDLEQIGRPYCEGRTGCRVEIWFDREYLALALPVDHQQTEAVVFAFGISLAGRETTQWNCTLFPEMPSLGRRCLPTTE